MCDYLSIDIIKKPTDYAALTVSNPTDRSETDEQYTYSHSCESAAPISRNITNIAESNAILAIC